MRISVYITVFVLLLSSLGYADEFEAGKSGASDQSAVGNITGTGGNVGSAGLGIQADSFSGAATFTVPLPLPPGRGGLAPKLILNYHSMRKNHGSWVGYGWELSLGSIVRVPKYGNVDYYAGTEFEVQLLGQTERLKQVMWDVSPTTFGLSVQPGTKVDQYEARVDSSLNIYLHLYDDKNPEKIKDLGWVVIDKNGTRYEFGTQPGINSSQNYALSPNLDKTWVAAWLLEKITDTNGNVIDIEYGIDQRPNKITYGDVVIQFEKTGYEKLRFFPIFREGFFTPQQVSRLDAIEVRHTSTNQRLLRYTFLYSESFANHATILTTIMRRGKTDDEKLPSITLNYFSHKNESFGTASNATSVSAEGTDLDGKPVFNPGYLDANGHQGNGGAAIMDMNADARPEMLLGFSSGKFIIKPLLGKTVETVIDDPLVTLGKNNPSILALKNAYGKIEYVKKFAGSYSVWAFIKDINGDAIPDRVVRVAYKSGGTFFHIAFGIPGKLGWSSFLSDWSDPWQAVDPGIEDHSAGLIDMNGDGLPDRVVGDSKTGGFNVYYNTGHSFSTKPVFWKDPTSAIPNYPGIGKINGYETNGDGQETDKLALSIRDVTGDGLPDRIYRTEIFIPDGKGGVKSEFGFAVAVNRNGQGWAQTIIDKNSKLCPTGKTCTLANAYDSFIMTDPVTSAGDRGYITTATSDLIDMNNDGYVDRVEGVPSAGTIRITYFSGLKQSSSYLFFDPADTVELADPSNDDTSKAWAATGYLNRRHTIVGVGQFTLLQDINGDGYPDRLVWTPRSNQGITEAPYTERQVKIYTFMINTLDFSNQLGQVYTSQNQPSNAIREINNGEGMTSAVEYVHSASSIFENRFLPISMYVIHKLYRTDIDSPADSSPEGQRHPGMRWATYYYDGGNIYLRYGEAGEGVPDKEYQSRFNGFQNVIKWHVPMPGETWQAYAEETHFYQARGDLTTTLPFDKDFEYAKYTDIALSGRPYYRELREGETVRTRQSWSWSYAVSPKDSNPDCPYSDCRPLLLSSEEEIFEENGASPRVTRTKYLYDKEDNVTDKAISAMVGTNGKLLMGIHSEFYPASEFKSSLWIRNRVKTHHVGSALFPPFTINRKETYTYDDKGNAITVKQHVDQNASLSINRKYDQYGNTTEWTGTDGVTHTHTFDGDKVFPVTESITLPGGQVLTTNRTFDRTTGKLEKELNPYGVGHQTNGDAFGRPIEEFAISATGNKTLLRQWSYEYLNDGMILKTQMWENQPGYSMAQPWQITYTDGNGRLRQSCSLAENGKYRRIQSMTQSGGRTQLQTVPVYESTGCTLLNTLAANATTTTTDIFGRSTLVQPPQGDPTSPTAPISITYTTENNGDTITSLLVRKTTLPSGTVRTEKINALGRTVFLDEGKNGVTAEYQYNYAGDLQSVATGGKTQMTTNYDWLGRKKTTSDADMGAWSYDYDSLGRLKIQTDAKGQKTEFDYDTIGRILEKRYKSVTGLEKTEVYSYDTGVNGFDVLPGELAQVIEKNANGTILRSSSFAYDTLYRRVAKMERNITGIGKFDQILAHNFKGQLTSTQYPGSKFIYQTYNAIGGLQDVCATSDCKEFYYHLNPNSDFDAYGSIVHELFGNSVEIQNNYYPNSHRLQSRMTYRQGKTHAKREYQYNTLSSLTQIADPLDQLGSDAMSGITYDGQDRLAGYQTKSGATIGFSYAVNGNILSNGDSSAGKTYAYAGPRPHAVTQIGSDTFDYDANGNMVKDASRTMAYSAANQLTQIKMTNGGVVDMDYDFTGARVLKKSIIKDVNGKTWQTVTHYLGEAVEIKLAPVELGADGKPVSPLATGETPKGTTLLHISANGQRIATMTLGTLANLSKPVAGTVWGLPYNQLPLLAAAALLLALLIVHFPRSIVMPGLTRHPNVINQNLSKGAIVALVLIIVQVATPPLAIAGDSGTPALPASDTDYLVYYHGNHLSSAQLITEGKTKGKHAGITYLKGDVIQRFEYAAFGRESFALNPNLSWDPAFTGQQYDIETGLYYYKARYYNPILGRFIQPDTIVQNTYDPQSWNRYAYVKNNPLKYTDPTGNRVEYNSANDTLDYSADKPSFGVAAAFGSYTDSVRDHVHDMMVGNGGLVGTAVVTTTLAIHIMTAGLSEQFISAGQSLVAGASWLADQLQSLQPNAPQLSSEEEMMISFAMGMMGGIKMMGGAASVTKVSRAFRYVGPEEAAFIEKHGFVPNVSRAGTPKQTSLTFEKFISSEAAEKSLKIGRFDPRGPRSSPTHGVEVDISSTRQSYGGNSAVGSPKIIEIRTGDPVRALRTWRLEP